MRLNSIKLAGFKSFVDATKLQFATNMTGIVGPNGCGKSNIIDAIRWVMGESAASRLRGDALTDVIFAGSSARKPVGQASVELIFDNSDQRAGGEWANYTEIAVKRVVSRDGQSQYFLNNVRARRRDITDLFLGTGLGPRSYSIIEQGMIGRIIEAKPEQLRVYLEEAAGISKYKERRRETENRMRATRENLLRVEDIQHEVDKQLASLQRQAEQAEKWKALRQQLQHQEGLLMTLNYRDYSQKQAHCAEQSTATSTQIEALEAQNAQLTRGMEIERLETDKYSDKLNELQAEAYKVSGEIARIDQQLKYNKDLQQRLERRGQELTAEQGTVERELDDDKAKLEEIELALEDGKLQVDTLESARDQAQASENQLSEKLEQWQQRHDQHQRQSIEANHRAESLRTHLAYLDKQHDQQTRRVQDLDQEYQELDIQTRQAELESRQELSLTQQQQVEDLRARLDGMRDDKQILKVKLDSEQSAVDHSKSQLQTLKSRFVSLKTLQQQALDDNDEEQQRWYAAHGFDKAPKLGNTLEVDKGWERAVESVLGRFLSARQVATDEREWLVNFDADLVTDLALIGGQEMAAPVIGSLAEHVKGSSALGSLLNQIIAVEDLAAARHRWQDLSAGQSLVTRQGEWFAPGWLLTANTRDAYQGSLSRAREMDDLNQSIERLEQSLCVQEDARDQLEQQHHQLNQEILEAQERLYVDERRFAELSGQLQSLAGNLAKDRQRATKLAAELTQLKSAKTSLDAEIESTQDALDKAQTSAAEIAAQHQSLADEQQLWLQKRERVRLDKEEADEALYSLALGMESKRANKASLVQAVKRGTDRLAQLQGKLDEHQREQNVDRVPDETYLTEQQQWLDQRIQLDQALLDCREQLNASQTKVKEGELKHYQVDRTLSTRREDYNKLLLLEQEAKLKAEQYQQAVEEAGQDLSVLLDHLAARDDADSLGAKVQNLKTHLERLEPVNLAAIDEHQAACQRKAYLDQQVADLTGALGTLEAAIAKIDRETRQRFKATFEQVNQGIQTLFPQLFGGGHAYLELTSDNLLDTGVSFMAKPPGKRVTSIRLLSGGEKAMAAVALVFAIFKLNPAPFCLLDEVDAPLDEANIGRFIQLLGHMSHQVQFIFITHNKPTMEAAEQLCGVTMREAGVSRMVQVDLSAAQALVDVPS